MSRKPDLTRFDFNVYQWLNSEDVIAMKDYERGQYISLMCWAWSLGKGCSLPNDMVMLAQFCNCTEVSPNVLKKFELNEEGRYVNLRLLEEWNEVNERVQTAIENGKKGASKRYGNSGSNPSRPPTKKKDGVPIAQTNPNQSEPTHTGDTWVSQELTPEKERALRIQETV